ncbi:MAG: glycine--tRNA ligase subunit beta [Bacillota bacterium]|nr:glycine--tRNA ligase subunit beta [Bacillota bacterium]
MAKDLLFEIGLEEIPARFLPPAVRQMRELCESALKEAGLDYQRLEIYATPRRLTLLVDQLAERAADMESEQKGPSLQAAYDAEGKPTRALEGFCRGQGVSESELLRRDVSGNTYLFARKKSIGKPAAELLPPLLLNVFNKLYFPKPMRWGYNSVRFARPVRWLVALLGGDVLELEIAGVAADRYSRGHRLLGSEHIEIAQPAEYLQKLADNYCIADQAARRELIVAQIDKEAASLGGYVEHDQELIEEVTYLVEYPTALHGGFEQKYLSIPEELVTTPMVDQQRYFPVYGKDGKLLPYFITVRNGDGRYLDIVAAGNEKVLRARLADAEFFYVEDIKDDMAGRVEGLSAVVFHEKLGTLRQKVERIVKLSAFIGGKLGYSEREIELCRRAAYLAKSDLASRVVYEFPELQGVIGEYYANAAGEERQVAQAIREHYLPRFAGDELPETKAGVAVALADKIDSLSGFFAIGLIPSGSQDPYALRRAAVGCAQIIVRHQLDLRIRDLLPYALELLAADAKGVDIERAQERVANIITFLNQRAENILTEAGVSYDIVNAVRETEAARDGSLLAMMQRAQVLSEYRRHSDFALMLAAVNRVANILRSARDKGERVLREIDPALFADASENALLEQVLRIEAIVTPALAAGDYQTVLEVEAKLAPYIDKFFEQVMVMDENTAVRENRIALLNKIIELTQTIGDLSKIVE